MRLPCSTSATAVSEFTTALDSGPFPTTSYAYAYIEGLLDSTAQAAYVANQAIVAASTPNDKRTFWGNVFLPLWNTGLNAIDATVNLLSGGTAVAAQTAVDTTTGGLRQAGDNAINNRFTRNTTLGPPSTQTAPLDVNTSFSSSNLLGLLLTNYFVQFQLNEITGTGPSSNNSNNSNKWVNPLWANLPISLTPSSTPGSCDASYISVSGNLFATSVECWNTATSSYIEQSAITGTPPAYLNVCASYTSNGTLTGSCAKPGTSIGQLNIWDAILTGSTVAANNNGMLVLQNPATWSFVPPTLISDPSILQISTNFNLNSGHLTLAEYIPATTPPANVNLPAAQYTPQSGVLNYCPPGTSNANIIYLGNGFYDASTGIISASTYSSWLNCANANPNSPIGSPLIYGQDIPMPNGSIALNLATCAQGSDITFQVAPLQNNNGYISSASYVCAQPTSPVSTDVVLDYNQCVNDPNAAGGILAGNISGSMGLACACIPAYIQNGSTQNTSPSYGYYSTSGNTTGIAGSACPSS